MPNDVALTESQMNVLNQQQKLTRIFFFISVRLANKFISHLDNNFENKCESLEL